MKFTRLAHWVNWLFGGLLVIVFLAALTFGQLYVQLYLSAPWRELVLLASLPVEYLGIAWWSGWMNHQVDAPALAATYAPPVAPIVLASRGAPESQSVNEALRVAHEQHKPVLLVNLITRLEADTSSWIENVWALLAEQGVHVSAQAVFTQEPDYVVDEVIKATGASYVILG
jgi:hypothetical protein